MSGCGCGVVVVMAGCVGVCVCMCVCVCVCVCVCPCVSCGQSSLVIRMLSQALYHTYHVNRELLTPSRLYEVDLFTRVFVVNSVL